jgi:predicted small lipoprotein YifL
MSRTALLTILAALGLLTACGKVGPPVPPGPANEVIYPRTYPTK